jgi:large subunit ribosomal protein L18
MAKGPRYAVKFRRRRENKTDYKNRLALLKSNLPRVVLRKTNKQIIAQLIEYKISGDVTKVHISSKDLQKAGWTHSAKNLQAAYLTGLLLSKKAKGLKIKKAVLDLGLQSSTKGNTLYAALKGMADAGLEIPHDTKLFPSEKRINGEHLKNKKVAQDFEKLKTKLVKAPAGTKKAE